MPADIATLQRRLSTLVPERYQARDKAVSFAPMRSAGLSFNADGSVAWNKIWGSFCDLALAGGPPHKGRLLLPASADEIAAAPRACQQVTAEICRGITLVTGLDAEPAATGWVRVSCTSNVMASWLLRAITLENVSVASEGDTLRLPAGPAYQLDKQIKNVITVIAKTCHYWRDHMSASQQRDLADLFATMDAEHPLIAPDLTQHGTPTLPSPQYPGWWGLQSSTPHEALRVAQLLLASNILARREDSTLFLPLNLRSDPGAAIVMQALERLT